MQTKSLLFSINPYKCPFSAINLKFTFSSQYITEVHGKHFNITAALYLIIPCYSSKKIDTDEGAGCLCKSGIIHGSK